MSPVLRVEDDGTVVYTSYGRYRPKKKEDRIYDVRQPDDPRAVRFWGSWYLPLEVLPEGARRLPETRPDDVAYDHARKPLPCPCEPCSRPTAEFWQRRYWVKFMGVKRRGRTQSRIDSVPSG